jgi:Ca2+-binding RTX toxin-like protein
VVPDAFGASGSGATAQVRYSPPEATFDDGASRPADATATAELLVAADVEPDADHDGYGDETQDVDLTVTPSGPETAIVGEEVSHVFAVRNLGLSPAAGATLSVTVSAGASVSELSSSSGSCTTGDVLRCALGTLRPGDVASVSVRISAAQRGRVSSSAHAASDVPDGVPANDDATVSTMFTNPAVPPPQVPFPNPPCANRIRGSDDDEVLVGTEFGDVLTGLGGRDLIRAGGGDDCLEGGRGADVLDGGPGADRLAGGLGADRLLGGTGDDILRGGMQADYLTGSLGADLLIPGPGRDRVLGGPGNDTVRARDGARDSIDCGPGLDTVTADRVDRLRNCEHRVR